VAWAELGEARVQVEFTRPAGHRDAALVHEPDDAADTDDIDDEDHEDDEGDDTDDDELGSELEPEDSTHDEHEPAGAGVGDASGRTGRPAPHRAPRADRPRRGGSK
jgi:ribosome maturation factor RimP